MTIDKDWFIGAQVVDADSHGITVIKDGITYGFDFVDDYGGCCGYNEFCANLLYERGAAENPVIVKVEEEHQDSEGYCETLVLTLLGESKPIAGINSESGSGSGWCYGACVKLVCSTANLELELTEW